jgi:hypothetical protein
MQPVTFKHHRSPADVIRLAVWLCLRIALSFPDGRCGRTRPSKRRWLRRHPGTQIDADNAENSCRFRKLYSTILMVQTAEDIA